MLKKWLKEYFEINKTDILKVVGLLLVGIIIGIGAYVFASQEIKQLLISSVRSVFDISKQDTYIKTNIIVNGIKSNILLIGMLAILALTLFGKWIIYIIMILKGTAISIYTILLFNVFGPLWGIVTTILLVIIVNILYLPAFIYLAVSFLDLNFNIFKTRINTINASLVYRILLVVFIGFVIIFSSIVVEQISGNIVLNIYKKI